MVFLTACLRRRGYEQEEMLWFSPWLGVGAILGYSQAWASQFLASGLAAVWSSWSFTYSFLPTLKKMSGNL
jgi:hypothetical protein